MLEVGYILFADLKPGCQGVPSETFQVSLASGQGIIQVESLRTSGRAFANPILQATGYLDGWQEGLTAIETIRSNVFDFYFSFSLGLMFAVAAIGFLYMHSRFKQKKKEMLRLRTYLARLQKSKKNIASATRSF